MTALDALNQASAIVWLKTNPYAYPALEVAHIVGIALVFGTLWVVDMRILGWMRALDIHQLSRQVLPWTWLGFALAALTGLTMFVSRVGDLIANPAFVVKMCLLFTAASNAAVLHARGPVNSGNALTRFQAVLSILIWVAVIASGRWIAYV
jgi:hypothetical protein